MSENGIECTIENMFDEGNKGKNNESESDSDEEKGKKGFSKTGKFEKKNILETVKKNNEIKNKDDNNDIKNNSDNDINENKNKGNVKIEIKEKENLISKTLKNSYVNNHLNDIDDIVDNKNCVEHNKIIRELKKQIEDLNFEMKEKDNIISTLEESNKMKQKQIESHKESSNIFSSNSNDIPKIL